MNLKKIFSDEQKQEVISAIKEAELNTSGEIRVHIENKCKEDVMDHAAFIFEKLKMHVTKSRNGVLFYLAISDRKFAILGDVGINSKVPEDFWDKIKTRIEGLFKQGDFTKGLIKGITMAGEQLKTYFPHQIDDINELSDEISFS
ncbi:MAG: TPM domain-containing protein [Bacteroidales bacterium]|nr:TPM domain-containing protein [Bacteroidales bacterium]